VTLLACSNTAGKHKTKINLTDCVSWTAQFWRESSNRQYCNYEDYYLKKKKNKLKTHI
jgi:hypothetical protein